MINGDDVVKHVTGSVQEFLRKFEFEVDVDTEVRIHYGHMPYEQQLEIFSNTIIYITMWGAALTNMIFLLKNAVIIPIYFPNYPGNQYYRMASNADVHYIPLRLQDKDKICWRPQEVQSHDVLNDVLNDDSATLKSYRERQQSAFLSRFSKGGWLYLRQNCAYVIPIKRLGLLVNQAVTLALKPKFGKQKPAEARALFDELVRENNWDDDLNNDLVGEKNKLKLNKLK